MKAFRHLSRINIRAGVGTLLARKWLPGLQRAGPSAPLDEECLFDKNQQLKPTSKILLPEI